MATLFDKENVHNQGGAAIKKNLLKSPNGIKPLSDVKNICSKQDKNVLLKPNVASFSKAVLSTPRDFQKEIDDLSYSTDDLKDEYYDILTEDLWLSVEEINNFALGFRHTSCTDSADKSFVNDDIMPEPEVSVYDLDYFNINMDLAFEDVSDVDQVITGFEDMRFLE